MPFSNHNYTRRAENSEYMPTPTIVEAAQALYSNHNVNDITRSDAGARNLTKTTEAIKQIIRFSKENRRKSIVFVTGVPGAGKTLVGLNLASEFHNNAMEEHAIFLSGNLPLVTVLQEALARDKVQREKDQGRRMAKDTALREVRSFIQIIHHYRDEYVGNNQVPTERVAIFDESQRAWTQQEISSFMARKKGVREFPWSEPEFLIGTMDRRSDWATIVCLVGGGQEINKGEAGLSEWFDSLKRSYPHWDVYAAQNLDDSEYLHGRSWQEMTSGLRLTIHCCPATIIGPVVRIQFLIVPVLRRHVCIVRNIPGKVLVRPDVRAKEPVVLVADADFAHGGLEQRRHTVHGIRDRVVVTIVWYAFYECSSSVKRGNLCTPHYTRQDKLEADVLAAIQLQVKAALNYDKLLAKLRNSEGERSIRDQQNALITSLNLKLSGISKKRTRLYEDFTEGVLDEEEYAFAKKAYDEQYADLSRRLDEAVQRKVKFAEAMSEDNKWLTLMKSVSGTTMLSQELVDESVELVKVHEDGSIELVMKYGDIYALTVQSIKEVQEAM